MTAFAGLSTSTWYLIWREPQRGVLLKGRVALLVSAVVWTAATLPAVTSSQLEYTGPFVLICWRIIHITLQMSQQRSKYSSLVSCFILSTCHLHALRKHTCFHRLINRNVRCIRLRLRLKARQIKLTSTYTHTHAHKPWVSVLIPLNSNSLTGGICTYGT